MIVNQRNQTNFFCLKIVILLLAIGSFIEVILITQTATGFGTESDVLSSNQMLTIGVKVMIPDTTAESGATLLIPIQVAEVTGQNIFSADMTLTFDQSVLDAQSVTTTGTIAQSWGAPTFSDSLGKIRIAMAGFSPLTGKGSLVFITFKVIGLPGQTTPLQLQHFTFNEGTPTAILDDGMFIVGGTPSDLIVSIPDTSATEGTKNLNIPILISDATGKDIYSADVSLTFDPNVLDAVGATTTGTIAANWGTPTINDSIGKIKIAMAGSECLSGTGVLVFVTFNVTGFPGQKTILHFQKLIFNEGTPQSRTRDGVFSVTTPQSGLVVSIPDTNAGSGENINIPIKVSDVTNKNIYSVGVTLTFDQVIIDAIDATTSGTIAQTWGTPTFRDSSGKIILAMAGSSALTGEGVLVYVTFKITGSQDQSTTLHFQKVLFNEGMPQAVTDDGIIKVTRTIKKVKVSIPDTSAGTGETIAIPVQVEDVTGLGINRVIMKLTFSQDILKIIGLSITGTIAESWGLPISALMPGMIIVLMNGTPALSGRGTLTYLNFSVLGSKDQSTVIHFDSLTFNMGNPLAIPHDGIFSVIKTKINAPFPDNLPVPFKIDQNYPNPFNSITTIHYQLPQTNPVTIKILDINGREIKTLHSGLQEPGSHHISWNGVDRNGYPISSGIYICQIQAGKYLAYKKLVYVK